MQQVLYFYEPPAVSQISKPPRFTEEQVKQAFTSTVARLLGKGAFGETWLVRVGGSAVAAKILDAPGYPVEYIRREVAAAQRVDHEAVVQLYREQTATFSDGTTYTSLLFEYVGGGDLATWLTASPTPSAGSIRGFAIAMLEGLEAMHGAGMVHRDIKPQNIAVRNGDLGTPVLLDLGLAKLLDSETITQYPAVLGTLPFMAPEQMRGEPARRGADIWSLGVVLYLLAAGRHPFYGGRSNALDPVAALAVIANGPVPLAGDVPRRLASAIEKMLRPASWQRGSAASNLLAFQNAEEG